MKRNVVVKYLNGYTVRGFTLDIGTKDIFHLVTPSVQKMEIRISELKAVFFVKSQEGDSQGEQSPRPDQASVKLVVQFFDDEEITGISYDYSLKKPHFSLFTLDPDDNNERVLVNRKAARFISRLAKKPGEQNDEGDVTFRKDFEREMYRFLYTLAQQFSDPRLAVSKPLLMNYQLTFHKEFARRLDEYVRRFGQDAWTEFLDRKLTEICFDMGDRALAPIKHIVAHGAS